MAGTLQPLTKQISIVNEDGTPNDYFIRWAQQRQVDISGGVTMDQVQGAIASALAAIGITGSSHITVTGSLSSPPINISWSAGLGDLTDVDFSTPPSSGQVLEYNGTNWAPATGGGGGGGNLAFNLGTMRPLTDFTQIAISGAYTVTNYPGLAITIKDTSPGTGFQLAGLRRAAPATPYRIVVPIQPSVIPVNYLNYAWGFTDGTKFELLGQYDSGRYATSQWNTATSRSGATLLFDGLPQIGTFYVCMEDNGTTVSLGVSSNGVTWRMLRSITKSGSFLGASGYTNACILLCNLGSGGASGAANAYSIAVREWDESGLTRGF